MTGPPDHRTRRVLDRCLDLGFARAGICVSRPSERTAELHSWLEAGRHGEMAYLANFEPLYRDADRLLPGARSIVCVADRYHGPARDPEPPPRAGRVARYARGRDYHVVIRRRLHTLADELRGDHPDHDFRACVDTAPLPEREHAQRAGLGAIGKHTLLIEPGMGSWLLLGALITTLPLEPSEGAEDIDPCATCTRCIDACPTQAITPWSVDATRCISYLTIEHRSTIDPALHEGIGDWLYGCDVCQEVCPHNQPTERSTGVPMHDAYRPARAAFDLLEVLGWTEQDRRDAFTRSAMKRAKLPMMKRNALIVAGNALRDHDDAELRSAVTLLTESDDELIRETACQVLDRLGGDV